MILGFVRHVSPPGSGNKLLAAPTDSQTKGS